MADSLQYTVSGDALGSDPFSLFAFHPIQYYSHPNCFIDYEGHIGEVSNAASPNNATSIASDVDFIERAVSDLNLWVFIEPILHERMPDIRRGVTEALREQYHGEQLLRTPAQTLSVTEMSMRTTPQGSALSMNIVPARAVQDMSDREPDHAFLGLPRATPLRFSQHSANADDDDNIVLSAGRQQGPDQVSPPQTVSIPSQAPQNAFSSSTQSVADWIHGSSEHYTFTDEDWWK
ncbi:hypothetical protein NA57DRAFT_71926 [Rhizodiscina lignyota]|uniref:Uncharacterized protein n=1 Tax=Rhizodiscina lignyota TaxID=1504668 RepID=A0A9P4MCZ2_9PEZI|nr:hypothetical protein NA57DRAFT_71926 [Rhizodiscina lignyota]